MLRSGEFAWIAKHFAPLAGPGSFGLKDDAAHFSPRDPDHDIVVTQDTLVAGVHFFADDPPACIAKKAIRVNVSDIVAKGAVAEAFLLSLSVPDHWGDAYIGDFAAGLKSDIGLFKLNLLGGDTTRSPERLVVTLTMFGGVPKGKYVTRMGAKPGDDIVLLGPIGDAALGLGLRNGELETDDAEAARVLIARQQVPEVMEMAAYAVRDCANAAMDVSDGLIGDLAKLCLASGARADIDLENVPYSKEAAAAFDMEETDIRLRMATGGDDYVVLMASNPGSYDRLAYHARDSGHLAHRIGTVRAIAEDDKECVRVTHKGVPVDIATKSYEHR